MGAACSEKRWRAGEGGGVLAMLAMGGVAMDAGRRDEREDLKLFGCGDGWKPARSWDKRRAASEVKLETEDLSLAAEETVERGGRGDALGGGAHLRSALSLAASRAAARGGRGGGVPSRRRNASRRAMSAAARVRASSSSSARRVRSAWLRSAIPATSARLR